MSTYKLIIYMVIMAGVTYLIRMLPIAVFRRKIKNKFVQSFLKYIPYAVLCAMTIPGIFGSTSSTLSAAAGFAVAVILAYFERSLIVVAMSSCLAVFIAEAIIRCTL